jgi:hypothetical protein
MMYRLTIQSRSDEPVYTRVVAAQLAQVSAEFLDRCEQEGWIVPSEMAGTKVYSVSDIRQVARLSQVRRIVQFDILPEELGRQLGQQLGELLAEMDSVERRMRQHERELWDEIRRLRSLLAQQREWRW